MKTKIKGYRNFHYTSNKTSSEVIEDLRQLSASISKKLDRRANLFKVMLSVSMILCFISFLLIFIVVGIYLLPLFIIATLYCSHQTSKYYALQKNNYRYSLSRKIVSMLYRDTNKDSDLNISIDFALPISKRKKLGQTSNSSLGNRKITNYFDPWFNIQGEFSDRTKYKLNIAEYYRNTSRWKTSRSGKRKWKSKDKFKKMEISLQLIYLPKKYGAVEILEKEAKEAIKLARTSKLKVFKIDNRSMLLKVYLPQKSPALIYETVASMFLSLYQILNLARTLSKVSN